MEIVESKIEVECAEPPQDTRFKCRVCLRRRKDTKFRKVIMRNECIMVMMMCGWCYISEKYHYLDEKS